MQLVGKPTNIQQACENPHGLFDSFIGQKLPVACFPLGAVFIKLLVAFN